MMIGKSVLEFDRELVSFERFVALMNEELARRPWYHRGLKFVIMPLLRSGYDLIGVDGPKKSAWAKEVYDIVSRKYES
jgi:hypothetical protein